MEDVWFITGASRGIGAAMLATIVAPHHAVAQAPMPTLPAPPTAPQASAAQPEHPYLGMWVTEDGYIRHELLPNGRYDEQRGSKKSAYQGRYWIQGNRIEYLDDTGFTADGEFKGDVFHHGGYVFRRERR